MLRATTYAVTHFGFATTLKLALMAAFVVGCLGAALLTGPAPEPQPYELRVLPAHQWDTP